MNAIFIRLDNNFDRAMTYREGVDMKIFSFNGVTLLPNQDDNYVQRTDCVDGIQFDSYTVSVLSICGEVLADVTENFSLIEEFDDPANGLPQVYWGIKNLPDFGKRLIYLRIETGFAETLYSSPFYCYSPIGVQPYRFHYRDDEEETMQCIGLDIYYKEDADTFSQEVFTTLSGDRNIAQKTELLEYEKCRTGVVDYKLIRLFKRMLTFRYKYCDYQEFTLVGDIEVTEINGDQNFVQATIGLQRNAGIIYDPNYVPPVPPPPNPYSILLNSVIATSQNSVTFDFEYIGFTGAYSVTQYSVDGINWQGDNPGQPNSPRAVTITNATLNNYYYRVRYPDLDVNSNVLQLAPASINLISITSPEGGFLPSGNRYVFTFNFVNFTPTSQIQPEVSTNGTLWSNQIGGSPPIYWTTPGNTSPKTAQTLSSGQEYKYFRIRYTPLNIVSNVVFHEF